MKKWDTVLIYPVRYSWDEYFCNKFFSKSNHQTNSFLTWKHITPKLYVMLYTKTMWNIDLNWEEWTKIFRGKTYNGTKTIQMCMNSRIQLCMNALHKALWSISYQKTYLSCYARIITKAWFYSKIYSLSQHYRITNLCIGKQLRTISVVNLTKWIFRCTWTQSISNLQLRVYTTQNIYSTNYELIINEAELTWFVSKYIEKRLWYL